MRTIEQMRKAFAQSGGRRSSSYPFWKLDVGAKSVIRFIPDMDEDNALGFVVQKTFHKLTVEGAVKYFTCPSTFGDPCPVCALASRLFNEKRDAEALAIYKKVTHPAKVLIIEDGLGGEYEHTVVSINIGKQLFDTVKLEVMDEVLDDVPWDFENGTDFTIRKTKQGEWASYTTSRFAKKSRPLSKKEVSIVTAGQVDLKTLLEPAPTEAELEAIVASLNL